MSKRGLQPAAWSCTTLTLAALLNGTGCLRFAYNEVDRKPSSAFDAGMDASASQNRADASSQPDAQLTAAGGSGGVGGSAASGAGGAKGKAGSGGSGSNADASVEAVDAGASDAAVADAGVTNDAGAQDASMPAAGSGGGAAAGGMGGGGAGGVKSIPFDQCMKNVGGVLFCDSFEEALPWRNNGSWGYDYTMGGSYERNTSRKYYGAASGHFSTTGSDTKTGSRIGFTTLGGKSSGELWLRYYYYIPNDFTINAWLSAGVMSEDSGQYVGFSLLIYPNYMVMENGFNVTSSKKTGTFPRNTWVCLEHHVIIDSSNGLIEVYMDGAPLVSSSRGNTIPPSGYDTAEVGIHYVGTGQNPANVYVDNVVVSTTRFGCDL